MDSKYNKPGGKRCAHNTLFCEPPYPKRAIARRHILRKLGCQQLYISCARVERTYDTTLLYGYRWYIRATDNITAFLGLSGDIVFRLRVFVLVHLVTRPTAAPLSTNFSPATNPQSPFAIPTPRSAQAPHHPPLHRQQPLPRARITLQASPSVPPLSRRWQKFALDRAFCSSPWNRPCRRLSPTGSWRSKSHFGHCRQYYHRHPCCRRDIVSSG